MIVHQHEAAEFGTEMAIDPLGQRWQDRTSIRRAPAFAPITGRAYRNRQVLNQKWLMPLQRPTCRGRGFRHSVFDGNPRRHLTAASRLLLPGGLRWPGARVHAAGFDVGAALQAFQTRDLFAQFSVGLFQSGDFTKQLYQQSLKLCTAQPGKGGWRRHIMQRIHATESAQGKTATLPTLLPLLHYLRSLELKPPAERDRCV